MHKVCSSAQRPDGLSSAPEPLIQDSKLTLMLLLVHTKTEVGFKIVVGPMEAAN